MYDIVVIGAGHAGCEAALAAARLKARVAVVALSLDSVALLACNPSIGGTAKGHLVREIDALGGAMGLAADATCLQFRMLGTGKGPAVQSLRAQADKQAYPLYMKRLLEQNPYIDLYQAEATEIEADGAQVRAVHTHLGQRLACRAAVVCSGVYLRGRVIVGESVVHCGPGGLVPANHLSRCLGELGFALRRYKTGTPPRILGRSINYEKTQIQPGDQPIVPFSFLTPGIQRPQLPCHLTYTNEATHQIIRDNLHRAPMYTGVIEGRGPRYCPSIEDKVVRFADKTRHPVFLEPEGSGTDEVYVQGISTSLPLDVQQRLLATIPGLERAHIVRPGYAIEYDAIDSLALTRTLESRAIAGLYFAGQVNGTSGYEEAAAQGLYAGANAALKLLGREPLLITRDEAYLGVLIDDLVTQGVDEPYRMMTSRAEWRLLLRQDNADRRLTPRAHALGLADDARLRACERRWRRIDAETARLRERVLPRGPEWQALLEARGEALPARGITAAEYLRRQNTAYADLAALDDQMPQDAVDPGDIATVEAEIRYEGYLRRQAAQVAHFRQMEQRPIPAGLDYADVPGLRIEARQKLTQRRPETLGQALRIPGVNPADAQILMVFVARLARQGNNH